MQGRIPLFSLFPASIRMGEKAGVTAAIDPYGRIVQSAPRKIRIALSASYALENSTTFYTRHGDWLAYACAIISIGAIASALTSGKGKRATQ